MKYHFSTLIILSIIMACNPSGKKSTATAPEHVPDTLAEAKIQDMQEQKDTIIVDSNMTFEEAIKGTEAPREIIDQLVLLTVEYYSTDDKLHRGQLVVNQSIAKDAEEIFALIKEIRFPVHQVVPIVAFGWNDDRSMAANNTSSFCYRTVAGTGGLSRHAKGKAIDINPYFNPLIWKPPYTDKPNAPEGAVYDKEKPGTFYPEHPVVAAFKKRKFTWGYHFRKYYDIHHFHRD